jgi:hypothetical protein
LKRENIFNGFSKKDLLNQFEPLKTFAQYREEKIEEGIAPKRLEEMKNGQVADDRLHQAVKIFFI